MIVMVVMVMVMVVVIDDVMVALKMVIVVVVVWSFGDWCLLCHCYFCSCGGIHADNIKTDEIYFLSILQWPVSA